MSGFRAHIWGVVLLGSLLSQAVLAQDSHYWNLHYGTQSTLLGGAVIGSVADLSAAFYNPGWLGLRREAGLILSARVYEARTEAVEGDGIQQKELSNFRVAPSPSLIAGRFPSDSLFGGKLTYSIITRQSFDTELETRGVKSVEPGPLLPNGGTLTEELVRVAKLGEYWGGMTWSIPLGDRVGIGVTTNLALRIQRRRGDFTFKRLDNSNELAVISSVTDYDYYNVRLLWKAGLAFDWSPLQLGLAVTTPSINLFGSGYTYVNASSVGFDINGDGNPDPFLVADYQDELSSTYKSSWAVGAGVGYSFDRFKLDVSAEWYNGIGAYTILDPQPFVNQTTGEPAKNPLTVEYNPVLNYGIGVEFRVTERIKGFLSYVIDFSAQVPGTETNLAVSSRDLRHITGGGVWDYGDGALTFGLGYAYGSAQIPNEELLPVEELVSNAGQRMPTVTATSRRIKLIFALSFDL